MASDDKKTTSSIADNLKKKLEEGHLQAEAQVEAGIFHMMEGRTLVAKEKISRGLRLYKATKMSVLSNLTHMQSVIAGIKEGHSDQVKGLKRELNDKDESIKKLRKTTHELESSFNSSKAELDTVLMSLSGEMLDELETQEEAEMSSDKQEEAKTSSDTQREHQSSSQDLF